MSNLCPPGFLFLCGPRENELPSKKSPNGVYHQPPMTLAYPFIHLQLSVWRSMHPRISRSSAYVTVHNITCLWASQIIGLILVGIGAAISLAAPWGGFAYHKATLANLARFIAALARDTGDALQNLQQSIDLLAIVVLDNWLALNYLLAEQGGICAVINKTCCTYINTTSQVEERCQKHLWLS